MNLRPLPRGSARDPDSARWRSGRAPLAIWEAAAGEFEVYEDKAGEYRWRLQANNNEIAAVSETTADHTVGT